MTDEQVLDHLSRRLCPAFPLSRHSAQSADDGDHLDKPECITAMRGPEKHVSSLTGRCRAVRRREMDIKTWYLSGNTMFKKSPKFNLWASISTDTVVLHKVQPEQCLQSFPPHRDELQYSMITCIAPNKQDEKEKDTLTFFPIEAPIACARRGLENQAERAEGSPGGDWTAEGRKIK